MARGEFSLVIVGLVGRMHSTLGPLVTAYVFVLALAGPLLTRLAGALPFRTGPVPGVRGDGPPAR